MSVIYFSNWQRAGKYKENKNMRKYKLMLLAALTAVTIAVGVATPQPTFAGSAGGMAKIARESA